MGVDVAAVFSKNWWATAAGLRAISTKMTQILAQVSPKCIIFYCLNNALFCGANERGIIFPKMDTMGTLHFKGEGHVLSKDSQYEVFKEILPILHMGGRRAIMIMPCQRW